MSNDIDNRKHRPPHAAFKINELIKLNKGKEAQRCTDENVAFYDAKIAEQQDLFLEAQCSIMGLERNRDNKFTAAIAVPKRRLPSSRIFGQQHANEG